MDIMDYLTPEERAAYAAKMEPSMGQRTAAFGVGVGDAIANFGSGRRQNEFKNFQDQMGQNMDEAKKDAMFLGEDRRKVAMDEAAKALAEKNRQGFTGIAGKYIPEFANSDIDEKTGEPLFNDIYGANMKIKQEQAKASSKAPKNIFQESAQREEGKKYADVKAASVSADDQIALIDDAYNSLGNYSKHSMGGTGVFATAAGLKKWTDQDTQDLDNKFKKINIKNMAQTFQGMSKAVDSNAERRAWEATQPSLLNDDKVNANILLGSKALAMKAKLEKEAQQAWATQYGNLDSYQTPILGHTKALMGPDGKMQIVRDEQVQEALHHGYETLDNYALRTIGTSPQQTKKPSGMKSQKPSKNGLPPGFTAGTDNGEPGAINEQDGMFYTLDELKSMGY